MNSAESFTFWRLINQCQISIPPLQRDYAQGRENDQAIKQIRESLIDELWESLTIKKPLILNFIYGETHNDEKGNKEFKPIDGQQRLTTLFLLHWYVFIRSEYNDGLEVLNKFSYQTRDTSKRFCENICSTKKFDFSVDKISDQIKDCYWLSGNFLKDPTVKSMLTMLDTIHARFSYVTDFSEIKGTLVSDDCPVTFLCLSMDNFQKTNDLYIKMNARGKLLSDFEIFKAKLQNSKIMDTLLSTNATEKDKIIYISRYNNEYAEFFYKMFQKEYDGAMMDFIKEIIRDSYFRYVSSCKVQSKTYRDDFNKIKAMNGSMFFKFIENGGFIYEQCKKSETAFIDGIKKMTDLLDKFILMADSLVFDNTLGKNYFNEKELFISNHDADPRLQDDVIRFAIYDFLSKFGIPADYTQKNAYCIWKRFVYNIVNNSDFGGRREDECEAFVYFSKIVAKITSCDEAEILKEISVQDFNLGTAAIKMQLKEEIIKAKLMQDAMWRKDILDAEDYFTDGQIGFILDCAETNGNYNRIEFEKYLAAFKYIFDGDKKLKQNYDEKLFEKAMLCMPDSSSGHTGHLLKQSNSTTSWGFLGRNYKEFLKNSTEIGKRNILRSLIDRISGSNDYQAAIAQICKSLNLSGYSSDEKWKIPFIQNDLFGVEMDLYYRFRNCINLSNNNREVLLIAGTTVRAYSMEVNTMLLYLDLKKAKKQPRLHLSTTSTLMDNNGFPLRYVEVGDLKIGYSYNAADASTPYLVDDKGQIKKMTRDDVNNIV